MGKGEGKCMQKLGHSLENLKIKAPARTVSNAESNIILYIKYKDPVYDLLQNAK
ncbi:unnamed protein product [Eretmochelys imbricata]